ncbi:hypothetical protein Poli38472_001265 [Pythium oligandrum]|uniref:Uncharacterized protein n=1 Tax=Pythium oligandrum TaxID=41045 RepID=A0A8K1CTS1_PYTOL|nr:hypothetical protein Poli38472_001265 [Pythium oligandrum]|eukprot:TMW69109.1 hypothetical protein Poli38472_001265 [Pythium oligandrum]
MPAGGKRKRLEVEPPEDEAGADFVSSASERLLSEADAWRIALTWQKQLHQRVGLVVSAVPERLSRNYNCVQFDFYEESNKGIAKDLPYYRAAAITWFALSSCRGYSGRENPLFWRRVFGALGAPYPNKSNSHAFHWRDDFVESVRDTTRFFDDDVEIFPRYRLPCRTVYDSEKLCRAFIFGSNYDVVKAELSEILDELSPYIVPDRVDRAIPVVLYTWLYSSVPSELVKLLSLTKSEPSNSWRSPRFAVDEITNLDGRRYGSSDEMKALFYNYPIKVRNTPLLEVETKLDSVQITAAGVRILEVMAKGNNLRNVLFGQPSQNTAYHSAKLLEDAVIYREPSVEAEVLMSGMVPFLSVDVSLTVDESAVDALPDWVCVIIPTYGHGWTRAFNILSIKSREPSPPLLKSLVVGCSGLSPREVLPQLISVIGRNLRFLDVAQMETSDVDTLDSVLRLCPFLESLNVHHDGAMWAQPSCAKKERPKLRELGLKLPHNGRVSSRYIPPSDDIAKTALRELECFQVCAYRSADFTSNSAAFKATLQRIPALQHFQFDLDSIPSRRANRERAYHQAHEYSWQMMGIEKDSPDAFALGNKCSLPTRMAFLSVVKQLGSARNSVLQYFGSDVVENVLSYVPTMKPRTISITNV